MIRSVLIDQGCSGEFNQMLRDRFNRAVLVLVRKEPGLSSLCQIYRRDKLLFLAVQNSSIGDLVPCLLAWSVRHH